MYFSFRKIFKMELKINFTKEELEQVNIMAYLAKHMLSQSDKYSQGYKYTNHNIFEKTVEKINTSILETISKEEILATESECLKIIKQYNHESLNEVICKIITERDYEEQGGTYSNPNYFLEEKYKLIYNYNISEIELNGLQRFRIVE